ncbi:MAG: GAF domain-containing protein, partial [Imperialibacter sp.]
MVTPPISKDEKARLADLLSYNILDTPEEEELDEIVQLASEICNKPISTITLIDEKRQWHKARKGIDGREGERDFAFCAHAIHGDDLMMVPDAKQDERFHDNPLVEGAPHIRFYAGVPLKSAKGYSLGTLCVIGTEPTTLTEVQQRALKILAKQVVTYFELR